MRKVDGEALGIVDFSPEGSGRFKPRGIGVGLVIGLLGVRKLEGWKVGVIDWKIIRFENWKIGFVFEGLEFGRFRGKGG
ncbi:hypothetical protein [Belliella pelovolcani]|uniref:Uncharacterized protein n=1 Tax=Belliella pelovolcani TaxID=529505 RepID=A0A1N7PNC8_9BACT|nr:hypothetical protein [Belliella pelovolcani]SIT12020.1 hypothetical protein SAMN05421761_11836 [Belliella pelovolcani]